MKKKALFVTCGLLMITSLAGCSKKPKSAEDVLKQYCSQPRDNYHMKGDLDITASVAAQGASIDMPVKVDLDFDCATKVMHGNMNMSMSMLGQSQEMSAEMYMEMDDKATAVYTKARDGASGQESPWTLTTNDSVTSANGMVQFANIEDYDFSKATFEETKDSYIVTIKFSELVKNQSFGDVWKNSTSSLGELGLDDSQKQEIIDQFADHDAIYTFDQDCNLTAIKMDDLSFTLPYEVSGITADMTANYDFDFKLSNFGKIKKEDVTVPEDVKAEAKGESTPATEATEVTTEATTEATAKTDTTEADSSESGGSYKESEELPTVYDAWGQINGTPLTYEGNKWDETFGTAGFVMNDNGDEEYSIIMAKMDNEDYRPYNLYVNNDSDPASIEDIEENGFHSYSIDFYSDKYPDISWGGLTIGASPDDVKEVYGESYSYYKSDDYYSMSYSYKKDQYHIELSFTFNKDKLHGVALRRYSY